MVKQTKLRIVEEVYGDQRIEDVFAELYRMRYGIKVKVTRKNSTLVAKELEK
ncbi:hypothetical protein ACE41A_08820 [Bacillus cytotoxicus]|uniref:hypothetical protein n=1 Tax=Bacillus cereus group TaxID=86661 RepID=UPI001F56A349|nr:MULTISPECIES: hypothetical protein [unclassified Bacillus cereus group]